MAGWFHQVCLALLLAVLSSATQDDSVQVTRPLSSLHEAEVATLLKEWKLDALADSFLDHKITGEALAVLEQEDVPQDRFPTALPVHFKLLFRKLNEVRSVGVPEEVFATKDVNAETSELGASAGVESLSGSSRRNLATSIDGDAPVEWSGVRIKSNTSAVFLGAAEDVGIVRSDSGNGQAVEVRGKGLELTHGAKISLDIGEFVGQDLSDYLMGLHKRITKLENSTKVC